MNEPLGTGVETGVDVAAADHLLTTTRAVRRRLDLDRPVEREVVQDCLRVAAQAPTAGNRQPWHWMVVTDPAKREAVAGIYREAAIPLFTKIVERAEDETTKRVYRGAIDLAERMHEVPVLVIPCVEGRAEGASAAVAAAHWGSILPAVWSFQLALRARGLGSTWTTVHLRREAEVAEVLGIPADVTQACLLPVAWTTGGDFTPARRDPIEAVTYFDSWPESLG